MVSIPTWDQVADDEPRLPEDNALAVIAGLQELVELIRVEPRFAELLVGEELTLKVTDRHAWDALSTILEGSDQTLDWSDYVTHVRPFGDLGVFSVSLTALKSVVESEVPRG